MLYCRHGFADQVFGENPMASKRFALVNQARCVACGACEGVCPREAISVFRGMYATVLEACCIGCGKCAKVCPAGCIELKERGPQA